MNVRWVIVVVFVLGVSCSLFYCTNTETVFYGIKFDKNSHLLIGDAEHSSAKLNILSSNHELTIHSKSENNADYSYAMVSEVNRDLTKAFAVTKNGADMFTVMGNGSVYCNQLFIPTGHFSDTVSENNYPKRTLFELEEYITQNKHLPNIPSTTEIAKKGKIEIGELQLKIVQKLEELTFYIIEQEKKIKYLQEQNIVLSKK